MEIPKVSVPRPNRIEVDAEYGETVLTFTYTNLKAAKQANRDVAEILNLESGFSLPLKHKGESLVPPWVEAREKEED